MLRQGQQSASLMSAMGVPYLLKATVPKSAVLAYIAAEIDRSSIELLIDFEKLTHDMIEGVTPVSDRWAA